MLLHAFINIILTESTRPPEHVYSVGGGDAVSGGATLVLAPPDCMLLDLITCNMHMSVLQIGPLASGRKGLGFKWTWLVCGSSAVVRVVVVRARGVTLVVVRASWL